MSVSKISELHLTNNVIDHSALTIYLTISKVLKANISLNLIKFYSEIKLLKIQKIIFQSFPYNENTPNPSTIAHWCSDQKVAVTNSTGSGTNNGHFHDLLHSLYDGIFNCNHIRIPKWEFDLLPSKKGYIEA